MDDDHGYSASFDTLFAYVIGFISFCVVAAIIAVIIGACFLFSLATKL
jgi:uncharacterized membrane protein (DUF106 family)